MKRIIAGVLLLVSLLAFGSGCENPNASPTDKVGGYHTTK